MEMKEVWQFSFYVDVITSRKHGCKKSLPEGIVSAVVVLISIIKRRGCSGMLKMRLSEIVNIERRRLHISLLGQVIDDRTSLTSYVVDKCLPILPSLFFSSLQRLPTLFLDRALGIHKS